MAATSWREFAALLLRFAGVGAVATALYFAAASICVGLHLGVLWAHGVGATVGACASYFGHKWITFAVRGAYLQTGIRFAATMALLISVQTLVVLTLSSANVPELLTVAISTLFYPAASFVLYWLWTFARPSQSAFGPRGAGVEPDEKVDGGAEGDEGAL